MRIRVLRGGLLTALLSLVGCATADPPVLAPVPPAEPTVPPPAMPAALPWPEGDDCRERLLAATALPDPQRRRLDPATTPFAVAVLEQGVPQPPGAREAAGWDLPVTIGDGSAAPCLVLLDHAPSARAAPRQPVAHEMVRSTYRRGTQRTANPEHEALRRRLREIERADDDTIVATGDPALDLVGLIAGGLLRGIGAIWRGREENEARAALAATPSTLAQTDWEPYTYQVTSLDAERAGRLRATLLDRTRGLSWALDRTVRERRRFKVVSGRLPKDRDLLEGGTAGLVTAADVTVWERGGLRPSLGELAAMLPAVPNAVPRDTAAIAADWAAAPAVQPAPPADDVEPPILAAGRSAGSAGVEQVVTPDGVRHYRLVEPAAGEPTTLPDRLSAAP